MLTLYLIEGLLSINLRRQPFVLLILAKFLASLSLKPIYFKYLIFILEMIEVEDLFPIYILESIAFALNNNRFVDFSF